MEISKREQKRSEEHDKGRKKMAIGAGLAAASPVPLAAGMHAARKWEVGPLEAKGLPLDAAETKVHTIRGLKALGVMGGTGALALAGAGGLTHGAIQASKAKNKYRKGE